MESIFNDNTEQRNKSSMALLLVSIGSMVMLFAGLTSAYVVRHGEGNWVSLKMPFEFYLSTAVILISSLTMNFAMSSIKKNDSAKTRTFLIATLVLGIVFFGLQYSGWQTMVNSNVFFTGKSANASGSFFYILTWLHALHLVGGLVAILITAAKTSKNKYSSSSYLGIKLCSVYWHFLGILWIYLFIFIMNVQ